MGRKKNKRGTKGKARPSRGFDPRGISAEIVSGAEGELPPGISAGDKIVVIEPVQLADERLMYFHAAHPTLFNLAAAERARSRAEKQRRSILGNLKSRGDGSYQPADPGKMIDCIEGLEAGVLLSLLAIEAFANHWIARLPDDAVANVPSKKNPEVPKVGMDRLSLDDKLKHAMVLSDEITPAAGKAPWPAYLALRSLRNDLVHPKPSEAPIEPTKPSPYGRLILGDGDNSVRTAIELIEFMCPEFLSDEFLSEHDLEKPASRL